MINDNAAMNHRERPSFRPTRLNTIDVDEHEKALVVTVKFTTDGGAQWGVSDLCPSGATAQQVASHFERLATSIRQGMLDNARYGR